MKVLLLRGWSKNLLAELFTKRQPSVKQIILEDEGHEVYAPTLSNVSFKKAVKQATKATLAFEPEVIIGSSRGAAIAANMQGFEYIPTIFLAPAWKYFGKVKKAHNNSVVIHGIKDTTIHVKDSYSFAHSPESFYLVDDNHRLNSKGVDKILQILNEMEDIAT